MKNLIITSADLKYGDFLINHWFKSLKDNVNLKNIDVAIVDYGLNSSQKDKLKKEGVILIPGSKNGNIGNLRFIDTAKFLQKNVYDQILFIDGGDIIFQDNISHLFEQSKDCFRAVGHELENLFLEVFIKGNFDKKTEKEIWNKLKNIPIEKTINIGVLFCPYNQFLYLCKQIDRLILNKNSYGPDQIVANYVIHQIGIKFLDIKYNFMLGNKSNFILKKGVFYTINGEKAAIVHNPGHMNTRVIEDFGYGEQYNRKINKFLFLGRRFLYTYITPVIKKAILLVS